MRLVPPQTVIFDEASQIEIGDYFPLLYRFQPTLQKLVFIGDDKQCMALPHPHNLSNQYNSGTIWTK